MTTKDIENWSLLTTSLSTDGSSRNNPSEYPHNPYNYHQKLRVTGKYFRPSQYGNIFIRKQGSKNLVKPTINFFSIKWRLKVIHGQAF